MIVLFILLFFSLFPSLSFFTSFYFLIFFGGGTCVISVFFSVLLLDGILAKKFVMPNFFCIGWVSFGFTKSVFVVCDHNIDPVFSVFTRGEIVTFKSFRLTKGFFHSGWTDLILQQTTLTNAYTWRKFLYVFFLIESNISSSKLSAPYFKKSPASYKDLFLTISPTTLIRNSVESWDCSLVRNNEIELQRELPSPLVKTGNCAWQSFGSIDLWLYDLKYFYRSSVCSRNRKYYTVK